MPRGEAPARLAVWALLVAGWLIAVWFMWDALTTLPSSERLETSRLVAIPTLRTFWAAALFSGLELAILLALLWPWRPELYATRVALALLGLVTWFIITTPLDITRMDWVHRRWMAATAAVLAATLVLLLSARGIARLRRSGPPLP